MKSLKHRKNVGRKEQQSGLVQNLEKSLKTSKMISYEYGVWSSFSLKILFFKKKKKKKEDLDKSMKEVSLSEIRFGKVILVYLDFPSPPNLASSDNSVPFKSVGRDPSEH